MHTSDSLKSNHPDYLDSRLFAHCASKLPWGCFGPPYPEWYMLTDHELLQERKLPPIQENKKLSYTLAPPKSSDLKKPCPMDTSEKGLGKDPEDSDGEYLEDHPSHHLPVDGHTRDGPLFPPRHRISDRVTIVSLVASRKPVSRGRSKGSQIHSKSS